MDELRATLIFKPIGPDCREGDFAVNLNRLTRVLAGIKLRAYRGIDNGLYVECVEPDGCAMIYDCLISLHEDELFFGPGTAVSWMTPNDDVSPALGGVPLSGKGFIIP